MQKWELFENCSCCVFNTAAVKIMDNVTTIYQCLVSVEEMVFFAT